MKIRQNNITLTIIVSFLLVAGIFGYFYDYHDIYLLSLDGRIESIRKDIKEAMYITVSSKEHNISHYWPKLQINVKVGDSVYKRPKEYEIILIKKATRERIICKYKEVPPPRAVGQ